MTSVREGKSSKTLLKDLDKVSSNECSGKTAGLSGQSVDSNLDSIGLDEDTSLYETDETMMDMVLESDRDCLFLKIEKWIKLNHPDWFNKVDKKYDNFF